MSRKEYREVAAILADARENYSRDDSDCLIDDSNGALSDVALELALMFKRDNPRFDAGRFFDAAGFPELTATRQGLN